MKRKWWLVPVVVALIGVLWMFASGTVDTPLLQTALGVKPAPAPAATKEKPICSQIIVPAGADCIPQHMANLPPDPGEAGKLTIEGIDADKDGVRDDVQRYIVENWHESERAVKALTMVAKAKQESVLLGDSLGQEETRKLWPEIERRARCTLALETSEMLRLEAIEQVKVRVTNTPERWQRAQRFDYQFAHGAYELGPDKTPAEACGFDPASLPN